MSAFDYIGSKSSVRERLKDMIEDFAGKKIEDFSSFGDLFAGTGAMTRMLFENKCQKIVYKPDFVKKKTTRPVPNTFYVYHNYSSDGTNPDQPMYFTRENGYK